MLTSKERAVAEAISDRLLELYVRRDEARRDDNWQEERHLQRQIEEMAAERDEFLAGTREE